MVEIYSQLFIIFRTHQNFLVHPNIVKFLCIWVKVDIFSLVKLNKYHHYLLAYELSKITFRLSKMVKFIHDLDC